MIVPSIINYFRKVFKDGDDFNCIRDHECFMRGRLTENKCPTLI